MKRRLPTFSASSFSTPSICLFIEKRRDDPMHTSYCTYRKLMADRLRGALRVFCAYCIYLIYNLLRIRIIRNTNQCVYILYVYSGVLQVSPAARYYFSHKKYCYVYVWKSDVQQSPQPLEQRIGRTFKITEVEQKEFSYRVLTR